MNEVINNVVLTEYETEDNSILEVTPDIPNTDENVIVVTESDSSVIIIIIPDIFKFADVNNISFEKIIHF